MSDYLFHLLWTAIWQSMLLAAIVLLAVRLLGERLQPRFRYMLWCLVLLRLAVPVLPETPWAILKSELKSEYFPAPETATVIVADLPPEFTPDDAIAVPPPEPFVPNEPAAQDIRQDEPIVVPETPPVVSVPKIPWKTAILASWLLGVIMFSVRHVFDELRLYRQSRYWKPIDEPAFLELFRCCCREAGVRRQVDFLSVPQDIGAASMGFRRPAVLVSQAVLAAMPTDQLRMVLLHELVHVRRFDPAVLRLASILSVIYWPNPTIWFVLSRLQRDRELACDAAVLHILDTNKEQASAAESPIQKRYGEAILAFAQRFSAGQRLPGLVGASQDYGNGRKHAIARRIDMILKYKRNKISHAVLGVFLVAVLAAFGLTRAGEKPAAPSDPETGKINAVDGPFPMSVENKISLERNVRGSLDEDSLLDLSDTIKAPVRFAYLFDSQNENTLVFKDGGWKYEGSQRAVAALAAPFVLRCSSAGTFFIYVENDEAVMQKLEIAKIHGPANLLLMPRSTDAGIDDVMADLAEDETLVREGKFWKNEKTGKVYDNISNLSCRQISVRKSGTGIRGKCIRISQCGRLIEVGDAENRLKVIPVAAEQFVESSPQLLDGNVSFQSIANMSPDDVYVFDLGRWTHEKTERILAYGATVLSSSGVFRLSVEGDRGKVIRLMGHGASGEGKYVRFFDDGNGIETSILDSEDKKKLVVMDEKAVFLFENGQWKDEKTGKEFEPGTLVQGTRGLFRLERPEDDKGKIVLITGAGAVGEGKSIRWSNGGNGFANTKPDGAPKPTVAMETNPKTSEAPATKETEKRTDPSAGKLDPKMVRFKGKATLPDGSPADGFQLLISGRSKDGRGGGTSNTYVEPDGSFTGSIFANADYMLTIFDPKGRFAAPSQYFTFKEEEEYPGEIVFKLEEGTRIIGKVVDETTSKPIPNIELSVSFSSKKSGEVNTFFKITADENGEYGFAAMPTETVYVNVGSLPKYHETLDFGPKEKRELTRKLLRKVVFDGSAVVNIDFRIPTPFIGKVLYSDGSPATGASVQMVNYRPRHPAATNSGMFVDTDENGLFRLEERPRHVFCTIWSRNRENFTAWFDDELLKAEEKVFQLQPGCRIEGRLVDSVTKKPLADQLLFLERSNPKKPEQLDFMPLGITKTDGDGFFNCSTFVGSGVRYELFVVPGRQQGYGGVPTDQRVNLKTVIPEKPGETVSVGDLEVDMTNIAAQKVAENPDAWREELFKKLADEVRDGKKKLMLKIFVKAPAQETIDYMLKHQNEEPLASFALYIVPYEKLSESGRKQWDSGGWSEEPLTMAVDPIVASKPSGVMTLSQLRGDSDSTWNVPDDDPSRGGDWKKSPGMINPEILKRFLRSMLSGDTVPVEKLLQFKPLRDDVDYDKPSPEDARRCTAKRLEDNGYIVTDPQGKTLRKFLDTTGDGRIDQWSYFKDGVEVWRDRDTDGDGLIDISDKP